MEAEKMRGTKIAAVPVVVVLWTFKKTELKRRKNIKLIIN
jgi:hypothetical protein